MTVNQGQLIKESQEEMDFETLKQRSKVIEGLYNEALMYIVNMSTFKHVIPMCIIYFMFMYIYLFAEQMRDMYHPWQLTQ